MRRSRATPMDWSLTKARLRPSTPSWRRRMILPSLGRPCSSSSARTAWSGATANSALTLACLAPGRSSCRSARPPRARPRASSRIDLPAPVSPVSTERPGSISRSRRSMRTTSRIDRVSSIAAGRPASEHRAEPGAVLPHRLEVGVGQEVVAVLIPVAAGIVVAEHGGGVLRLVLDAERQVALGEPLQRLRHVGGGLVELDHAAEAVDGRQILLALEVEAADLHLLAGEVVAGEVELEGGVARIVGVGEAGDDVV